MSSDFLSEYKERIDKHLSSLLSKKGELFDNVIEAASYSVSNGGKRIRPILLLEFYKLCGGEGDYAYDFACALEMIHTYSLIHDDLPCMDNDDFRRGKPSCHKQYGEVLALLAGDGLLTEAFCVASRTENISSDRVKKAINMMSSCAGISGMVGGQVIDTVNEGKEMPLDTLLEMYRLKTGALLKAAACCGAILAGADEKRINLACEYAENMGIAFQIIDDILDTVGDPKLLGKPVGSDEKNGKITVCTLLGVEKARLLAKDYTDKSLKALENFDGDSDNIRLLTEKMLVRKY